MNVNSALKLCRFDEQGRRHAIGHSKCNPKVVVVATNWGDKIEFQKCERKITKKNLPITPETQVKMQGDIVEGVIIRDTYPDMEWTPMRPREMAMEPEEQEEQTA